MLEKEFVPVEEALALKELGFKEECLAAYFVFGDGKVRDGYYGQTEPELFINGIGEQIEDRMEELKMFAYHASSVPTFSQAFRWFRDKYKLHYPIAVSDGVWFYAKWSLGGYKTYEEAELACLKKLIEIANGKQ